MRKTKFLIPAALSVLLLGVLGCCEAPSPCVGYRFHGGPGLYQNHFAGCGSVRVVNGCQFAHCGFTAIAPCGCPQAVAGVAVSVPAAVSISCQPGPQVGTLGTFTAATPVPSKPVPASKNDASSDVAGKMIQLRDGTATNSSAVTVGDSVTPRRRAAIKKSKASYRTPLTTRWVPSPSAASSVATPEKEAAKPVAEKELNEPAAPITPSLPIAPAKPATIPPEEVFLGEPVVAMPVAPIEEPQVVTSVAEETAKEIESINSVMIDMLPAAPIVPEVVAEPGQALVEVGQVESEAVEIIIPQAPPSQRQPEDSLVETASQAELDALLNLPVTVVESELATPVDSIPETTEIAAPVFAPVERTEPSAPETSMASPVELPTLDADDPRLPSLPQIAEMEEVAEAIRSRFGAESADFVHKVELPPSLD